MNHGVLERNSQCIYAGTISRNRADSSFCGYVPYLVGLAHLIVHCGRLRPDPLSPRPGGLWGEQDPYGWFDEGVIYAIIGGEGDSFPLAVVDDASRVIKYVGILGYRYQSYGLVDMRIHDISVVADLTRSNPTVPAPGESEVYDGTGTGIIETLEADTEAQSLIDSALSLVHQVVWWWVGWWPRLHTSISFDTPMGGIAVFWFSVDLLFDFRVEDTSISTPVANTMTSAQLDDWSDQVIQATVAQGDVEHALSLITEGFTWVFAAISAALAVPGLGQAAYVKTVLAALALWTAWFILLVVVYMAGLVSCMFIIGLLSAWLTTFLGKGVILLVGSIWLGYLIEKGNALKDWTWLKARIIMAVVSLLLQFTIAVITFYLFVTLVEISMQVFMEAQT